MPGISHIPSKMTSRGHVNDSRLWEISSRRNSLSRGVEILGVDGHIPQYLSSLECSSSMRATGSGDGSVRAHHRCFCFQSSHTRLNLLLATLFFHTGRIGFRRFPNLVDGVREQVFPDVFMDVFPARVLDCSSAWY